MPLDNKSRVLNFELDSKNLKIKDLIKNDFLELKVRAVSDANPNLNRSHFTVEAMKDAIPSFVNRPILGSFSSLKNDFRGHNDSGLHYDEEMEQMYYDYSSKDSEKILGMIRESDPIEITYDSKTKLTWLSFTAALWTNYSYKAVKSLLKNRNGNSSVSVEVEVLDSYMEDGIEHITKFNFLGCTILGSDVTPGIPGANLTVRDFEANENYEQKRKCLNFAYQALDDYNQKQSESLETFESSDSNIINEDPLEEILMESEPNDDNERKEENEKVMQNNEVVKEEEQFAENEKEFEVKEVEAAAEEEPAKEEESCGKCEADPEPEQEKCEADPEAEEPAKEEEACEKCEAEEEPAKEEEAAEEPCPDCGEDPCVCEEKCEAEEEPAKEEEACDKFEAEETVSKSEYDSLMEKYTELNAKFEALTESVRSKEAEVLARFGADFINADEEVAEESRANFAAQISEKCVAYELNSEDEVKEFAVGLLARYYYDQRIAEKNKNENFSVDIQKVHKEEAPNKLRDAINKLNHI